MFEKNKMSLVIRVFSYSILATTFVFLINNVLTVWFDWPGVKNLFSHYGLFGFKKLSKPLSDSVLNFAFLQLFFYLISILLAIFYVNRSIKQTLTADSEILNKFTAYIIRSSFWAVLIVGIADLIISFLVVEKEILEAFDLYLSEENLELYDLNIVDYPSISRVEVYIVSDNEIDIDLTSRLNKQFQRLLENMGIEKGSYEMIVSSPGIERKLKTNRHFELALGELVKIKLFEPIEDEYVLEGYIESSNEQDIKLIVNSVEVVINFSNIKSAKIEFKQFKEKVKG